jgi:hypothetical protein
MDIVLLSLTDQVWDQFSGFYKYQNLPVPLRPHEGVWVGLSTGEVLAGACIYPCDVAYAMVEHIAFRPGIQRELAAHAVNVVLFHLASYGSVRGRMLVCFPRSEAMGSALELAGFMPQDAVVYTLSPLERGGAGEPTIPWGEVKAKLGLEEKKAPAQQTGGHQSAPGPAEESLLAETPAGKNVAKPRKR